MFPSEHFFVAFLPVLMYIVLRDRRLLTPRLMGVVFIGSQFPDLVDKPLAHQFGIIPSGRVFMHSLPIAIPFLIIIGVYAWRTERPLIGAVFVFAYLSHLLADNYKAFLVPDPQIPPDLLWPFAPPIARPISPHWAGSEGINVQLWTLFSTVVLLIVVYLSAVDIKNQIGIEQRGES